MDLPILNVCIKLSKMMHANTTIMLVKYQASKEKASKALQVLQGAQGCHSRAMQQLEEIQTIQLVHCQQKVLAGHDVHQKFQWQD